MKMTSHDAYFSGSIIVQHKSTKHCWLFRLVKDQTVLSPKQAQPKNKHSQKMQKPRTNQSQKNRNKKYEFKQLN